MLSLNPPAKANKIDKQQFSMRYGELAEPLKGLLVLLKGISPESSRKHASTWGRQLVYKSGQLVIDFNFTQEMHKVNSCKCEFKIHAVKFCVIHSKQSNYQEHCLPWLLICWKDTKNWSEIADIWMCSTLAWS